MKVADSFVGTRQRSDLGYEAAGRVLAIQVERPGSRRAGAREAG